MSGASPFFRAGPLAWLIGAAFAATIAATLLLAYGGDLAERHTAGSGTYSDSAVGHRALFEFIRDSGVPAVRNHESGAPALTQEAALVIIEPDWNSEHPRDNGLLPHLIALAAQRARPVVVVLPKWTASVSPFDPRYVDGVSPAGVKAVQSVAAASTGAEPSTFEPRMDAGRATYRADAAWGTTYDVALFRAQVLAAKPGLTPMLSCADGLLVASVLPPNGPPIVLVADPDLINNQGLGRADHAALFTDLIAHLDGVRTLVFDETVHGDFRHGQLLASLLRFPALPITLQLLIVAAAAVWAFTGRFGKPQATNRGNRGGREVFIDTTARLLEGSMAEGMSLERYWRQVVEGVAQARRIPLGDRSSDFARLASDSAAVGTTDDPRTLAAEAADASEGRPRPEHWIAVATKIDRWRREMMHGPRTTP